jgi:hypothetical protein
MECLIVAITCACGLQPGQQVNFMTAEPGSETADRLCRLAAMTL